MAEVVQEVPVVVEVEEVAHRSRWSSVNQPSQLKTASCQLRAEAMEGEVAMEGQEGQEALGEVALHLLLIARVMVVMVVTEDVAGVVDVAGAVEVVHLYSSKDWVEHE